MFLVVLKKKFIMEFIYCCRLKPQYFGAPKSGAPKMRGLPAVAGIARGVPTPLMACKVLFFQNKIFIFVIKQLE